MKHIGIDIRAIRPDDRTEFGMELNFGELIHVTERREDPLKIDDVSQIQIPLETVFEAEVDTISLEMANLDDILQHGLPQRLDGPQRGLGSRQSPILHQLPLMDGCPLHDESKRTRRKRALQHRQRFNADERTLASLPDVEVRRGMVVVEHGDDDPKKPTDLWHRRATSGRPS